MRISEVKSTTREQRIAPHTHIKGLGLNDEGRAYPHADGFVGQTSAREVVQLFKHGVPQFKLIIVEYRQVVQLWI